jgi:hypothetical protein
MPELVAYVATGVFYLIGVVPAMMSGGSCWPSALPAQSSLERIHIERAVLVQDEDGGVAMLVGDRYVARSRRPLLVYRRGVNIVAVDADPDSRSMPIWVNAGAVAPGAPGTVRAAPGPCRWTQADRQLIGG